MSPFFSVVIPTYNHAGLITRAIQSVFHQEFADVEVIVVDDGSTDNTRSKVEEIADERLLYCRQDNAGPSAGRNRGAGMAQGRFLLFLDSDDTLSGNYLQRFHDVQVAEDAVLLLGSIEHTDAVGTVLNTERPWKRGSLFSFPICGSFVISRELFQLAGGYDEKLTYSENSDLFLTLRTGAHLDYGRIALVEDAGVRIEKTDSQKRNLRYSRKRYDSVRYFVNKHRAFFEGSPKDLINFKRVEAISAFQNKEYAGARNAIGEVVRLNPFSMKSYLQWLLLHVPPLARRYYGS